MQLPISGFFFVAINSRLGFESLKFDAQGRINEYFHEFSNHKIFVPRNNVSHLNESNVSYHRKYVFEGGR